MEGSDKIKKYWDQYFSKVGTQGDYIEDLIEIAKRRPYGRKGNLSVIKGTNGSYEKGIIEYSMETKRWEFIEEFIHYYVHENNVLQKQRKLIRTELKPKGFDSLGRVAEEITVKEWLIRYRNIIQLDDATIAFLESQIKQLKEYGIEYGY